MYHTAPWILFIHGFATGFLSTWLGLVLVKIRPNLRKVSFVAFCYAVMATIVRSIAIPLGVQFTVMTFLLIIIIMLNWNLTLFKAAIAVILGTIIMALGEALSMSTIFGLTNISADYVRVHQLVELILPLPQILLTLIIIFLCLKFDLSIFDFSNLRYSIPNEKRVRSIVVLASTMLLLLLIQIVSNIFFSLYTNRVLHNISPDHMIAFSTVAMVLAFIIMVLIIQQLFILLGTESAYITQSAYVQTLDELYTATRAEAHDRINHMQTLYGFVQLGELDETRAYLEELIGEIVVSQNYFTTGHPALSALFYIKSGLASARGIQLEIITETKVDDLVIPPHELNRILGNLINNAFDSVAALDKAQRKVYIEVTKHDKLYRFRIGNCGKLEPGMKNKIFNRGYSTKAGEHQGLGLYIVRQLVEKYRGQVEVDDRDGMVVFSLYIPESNVRSDASERLGSNPGQSAGGEFDVGM